LPGAPSRPPDQLIDATICNRISPEPDGRARGTRGPHRVDDVNSERSDGLLSHGYAISAAVRLHFVEKGSGPAVVLLHGIPESWITWRHHIDALADNGYRAVAPDLRGYNLSDKPRSASAYGGALLAEDVAATIRATGHQRASVVGQGWGALAAWLFAMRYPDMLDRLVIMSVPHPLLWVGALRTWRFWRTNWHVLFFQVPVVPEFLLQARNSAVLRRRFERDLGGVDAGDPDDIEVYIRAMSEPGALTGALNYYRAFLRENPFRLGWPLRVIDAPVLVIWGALDPYFQLDLARPPRAWVPSARTEILPDARHWTHRDQPEAVLALLLAFLRLG
jgi:epoxide hydrolase 4